MFESASSKRYSIRGLPWLATRYLGEIKELNSRKIFALDEGDILTKYGEVFASMVIMFACRNSRLFAVPAIRQYIV